MVQTKIKDKSEILYTVPITECEILEEKEGVPQKARIGGVCLKPVISRNSNKYTVKNITENDNKEVKFFVQQHGDLSLKNVVGKMKLIQESDVLRYDGVIRNTKEHPEIVQHALEKEIDVSIDARWQGRNVESVNGQRVYSYDNIDIRALCGVGIGGVKENSMDYVIAESFNGYEEKLNEENKMSESINYEEKLAEAEKRLAEQEKLLEEKQKVITEREENDKRVAEAKRLEEKENLINEIKKLNSTLEKLEEKEIQELKVVLEYEKKLSESAKNEGAGEYNDFVKEESKSANVLIEAEKDMISMDKKMYDNFRKEIEKNI